MPARDAIEDQAQTSRPVTGRMVLVCLIGFFAVVAGINAVMAWLAVSTFGGVETANAYQAGLAFAREIAAVEAQDALHWHVTGRVSSDAGATRVEVIARDRDARPLSGLGATARLVHPTDRRADQIVPLEERAPGSFRGMAPPVTGQWSLDIELARDGIRLFRSRNRVFVR